MTGCCVPHCRNRSEKGFRLFRLPCGEKNKKRREYWVQCIGRPDLNPNSVICEVHFSEKQFECKRADNRRLLCAEAVPDLLISTQQMINNEEINDDGCIENTSRTNLTSSEVENFNFVPNNDDNFESEINALLSDTEHEDQNIYIEKMKCALKRTARMCNVYKRRCEQQERLKITFDEDQLMFLKTGSHRGIKWSEETLIKALKLYLACGEKGYAELKNQNLPYPSIRTLQRRLRILKFEAGVLEDMQLKDVDFQTRGEAGRSAY